MTGEVTSTSVILQSRLTESQLAENGDVPSAAGVAKFEWDIDADFSNPQTTEWLVAQPETDYIVKTKLSGLAPGTRHYYRLVFGPNKEQTRTGPTRTFRTWPEASKAEAVSFVVVTGMNYAAFHHGRQGTGERAYQGPDKHLGYPALAAMLRLKPDFFVGTGDNVYYDHPHEGRATDAPSMRKKWHEQFVQPRYRDLFASVPTYWEKDDHDHRYNDNDNTGDKPPSSKLGIRIFREQVPITDPEDPQAVTYRTHRINRLLQIWLLEGRDYRSPNNAPDGPDKTIWGNTQRDWLQETLRSSDAPLKIVISPTPLVGPDGPGKRDNHTNIGGFRHEGTSFLNWAKEAGLLERGLYFVCGDRHWQYHSIHPTGFEEFSSGALVDANSRLGVAPGNPRGSDPQGEVRQPFTSVEPTGGFLRVRIVPAEGDTAPSCHFEFFDENGALLHSVTREAN